MPRPTHRPFFVLLLLLVLLASLGGCQSMMDLLAPQAQGQGDNRQIAVGGHARGRAFGRTGAMPSEGNKPEGSAEIPLVWRDKDGRVHPVLTPDGRQVITRVEGSGIVVYVNSDVDNSADNTISGTVEGSTQEGARTEKRDETKVGVDTNLRSNSPGDTTDAGTPPAPAAGAPTILSPAADGTFFLSDAAGQAIELGADGAPVRRDARGALIE